MPSAAIDNPESEHLRAEKAKAGSLQRVVSRRRFSEQFQICNADGTCQHMTERRHNSMPMAEQTSYREHMRYMAWPDGYFGPRGPLFCTVLPGQCSSKHCPKLKAANAPS